MKRVHSSDDYLLTSTCLSLIQKAECVLLSSASRYWPPKRHKSFALQLLMPSPFSRIVADSSSKQTAAGVADNNLGLGSRSCLCAQEGQSSGTQSCFSE